MLLFHATLKPMKSILLSFFTTQIFKIELQIKYVLFLTLLLSESANFESNSKVRTLAFLKLLKEDSFWLTVSVTQAHLDMI